MKNCAIVLLFAALILSCGGRKVSPEELAHKLDSLKQVDAVEKLKLQGIDPGLADNPLKIFYDSLTMQDLPLSYTEDYVKFLPGFAEIPQQIASYMNIDIVGHHKAIYLPETVGAKLILVAIEESAHLYSLWIYSLDDDYYPVDKLCLYAAQDKDDQITQDEFVQYFSITSDYEIHLLDYSNKKHKLQSNEIYYIDSSRHFLSRNVVSEPIF